MEPAPPNPVPRRRRSVALICATGLAVAIAGAATAAAAPWYEHYAKAEKALAEGSWEEAVEEITQALEKKGDSGARVRTYGMKVTAYFPYLKLGIAYYQLGQHDAALQAFETEERLGAIAESDADLAELQLYRARVEKAQQTAERQRIRQIVEQNLARAEALEGEGRLDEAMAALGRVLAVAPDEPTAVAAMERLRSEVGRRQEEQRIAERLNALVREGRELLAAGSYGEASARFRQALALRPSPETQALFDQAQARLQAELRAQDRATLIAEGLERARRLQAAGEIARALDELQSVLALDPGNQQAQAIETRLLATRADAEEASARRQRVDELLARADAELAAGRPEGSLAAANRVLALDPGNTTALQAMARAYGEINRSLLAGGPRRNIPPAIRFVDRRQELEDGLHAQLVRDPDFRLSGVVIDDSPVEIAFYDAQERPLQGTVRSQPAGDVYIIEFTLAQRLDTGVTTFRLVATDDQETSSASDYAVVYARPFFRAPWFYGTVAGSLLLALGTVFEHRRRRRQRLLTRRFNPYVAGAPVLDEELFFGRQRLIERILQTIHNNSLLLHGERRIGKTTVQHHLKRRLQSLQDPDYDFYPVYIDLQGTPQERFFATMAEDIFQELAPHLDGLEPSAALSNGYSYREFVRDMREVLKALKRKSPKQVKLVLLIDEVDELNDYDPKVNQKLRSLFMKSFAENLVSVVAGVEIKKHWEREGSPWYNFFEEIEVQPFQPDDARELIERPIRGVLKLEEGVVERIIELTDCRPYLIQKLCVALVNRVHEDKRRRITVADVEALGRPEEG